MAYRDNHIIELRKFVEQLRDAPDPVRKISIQKTIVAYQTQNVIDRDIMRLMDCLVDDGGCWLEDILADESYDDIRTEDEIEVLVRENMEEAGYRSQVRDVYYFQQMGA